MEKQHVNDKLLANTGMTLAQFVKENSEDGPLAVRLRRAIVVESEKGSKFSLLESAQTPLRKWHRVLLGKIASGELVISEAWVKIIREEMKLTQPQFAGRVGVSRSQVGLWEIGNRLCHGMYAARIILLVEKMGI